MAQAPQPPAVEVDNDAPPLSRPWFIAFVGLVTMAVLTVGITTVVRAVKWRQVENRQAALHADDRFQDVEQTLRNLKDEVAKYQAVIDDGPKLRGARQRLLVRKNEAEQLMAALEARTGLSPADKEQQRVMLERQLAAIQIDLNTNRSEAELIPTAQRNLSRVCRKMKTNVNKLKRLEVKEYWAKQVADVCAGVPDTVEDQ